MYEDLFKVEYPLTKLDLVFVPEFPYAALECSGCIILSSTTYPIEFESASETKFFFSVMLYHEMYLLLNNYLFIDLTSGLATWLQ
jgi:aminopeptidase N